MTELVHPLLAARGVAHGFGTRGAPGRPATIRPRQVHGVRVAVAAEGAAPGEADAILATAPGIEVGVVTADCVPILLAAPGGAAVAAVHAGWRGLAAGVVGAALEALRAAGAPPGELVAAVGPHVGACCYEVDAPVLDALRLRFRGALDAACTATRPGHARLSLLQLVRQDLRALPDHAVGSVAPCTQCDAERFHSYRRDGPAAGRMLHWIATCRP